VLPAVDEGDGGVLQGGEAAAGRESDVVASGDARGRDGRCHTRWQGKRIQGQRILAATSFLFVSGKCCGRGGVVWVFSPDGEKGRAQSVEVKC
jgi:hypothetical protein